MTNLTFTTLVVAAMLAAVGAQASTAAKDPGRSAPRAATAEEIGALNAKQPASRKAAFEPRLQRMADGAESMPMDESTLSYSVVSRKPDGSLQTACVTGEDEAKKVLKGGAAAAQKEARHAH